MAIKTITVKGEGVLIEGIASGTVSPGMLLERTNAANTMKAHATSGGKAQTLFAVEDELQGNTVSDDYATTKRMFAKIFRPGDQVLARCANGQNLALGDFLCSNGDGKLRKCITDSSGVVVEDNPVAVCQQAIDFSGSSGEDPSSELFVAEIL